MTKLRFLVAGPFTVVAMAACTVPTRGGAAVRFQGEALDPSGDTAAVADARVKQPADLVFARAQVTDDEVQFSVRFAPGSLDSTSTGVMFVLDTDRDSTTGQPTPGLGEDYLVALNAGPTREATIARAVTDPGCRSACRFDPFQTVVLRLSTDEMDAVVSRRAFTGFDGRFNFRVIAYTMFASGSTVTSDHLPNLPAQFVLVR